MFKFRAGAFRVSLCARTMLRVIWKESPEEMPRNDRRNLCEEGRHLRTVRQVPSFLESMRNRHCGPRSLFCISALQSVEMKKIKGYGENMEDDELGEDKEPCGEGGGWTKRKKVWEWVQRIQEDRKMNFGEMKRRWRQHSTSKFKTCNR